MASTARKRAIARDGDEGLKILNHLKDETEQDEEISRLEREIVRTSHRTSRIATIIATTLCAMNTYFAISQYMWPFSLRHHAAFADTGISSLYVGELGSALSVGLSAFSLVRFVHPRADGLSWKYLLNSSIMITALQMIYWLAAGASLYVLATERKGGEVPWGLIWWKPIPGILMFMMSVLSIDSISRMQIDLGLMRKSKYRFKSI
jgi:hypothetical protein